INACDNYPRFTLSASPASRSLTAGGATTYTVTVAPFAGFAGPVTLSASGLPSGVTAAFTPSIVTTSGTATMTLSAASQVNAGAYSITVSGVSGVAGASTTTMLVDEAASPTVDRTVNVTGNGTVTTAAFSTSAGGEWLFAFAAADGPEQGAQTLSIGGAGLTWTLVQRANTQ